MYSIVDSDILKIEYELVEIEEGLCIPSMHTKIHKWSKDVLMKSIWPSVIFSMDYLYKRGYSRMYAFSAVEDTKARKFQEMVGFTYLAEAGEGVVMTRSTSVGESYGS